MPGGVAALAMTSGGDGRRRPSTNDTGTAHITAADSHRIPAACLDVMQTRQPIMKCYVLANVRGRPCYGAPHHE